MLSPAAEYRTTESQNEASRHDAPERRLRRYSEGGVAHTQVGGTVCHVMRTACMRTTNNNAIITHGAMAQDDANPRICVTERSSSRSPRTLNPFATKRTLNLAVPVYFRFLDMSLSPLKTEQDAGCKSAVVGGGSTDENRAGVVSASFSLLVRRRRRVTCMEKRDERIIPSTLNRPPILTDIRNHCSFSMIEQIRAQSGRSPRRQDRTSWTRRRLSIWIISTMENNHKSKSGRRGNNRRRSGGNKENKREIERMKKAKSEESIVWSYPTFDNESRTDIADQETFVDLENFDNENENNPKASLMCPALRRQLQTHKNVLRLLHEHKLASTQINGQRILSIQPIRWTGPTPGIDCEIFVGRIPKTIYEDTLYPLFKTIGEVFQIRLMVDMAELTRGYCFIMYTNPEDAGRAIVQLDQFEISPGKKIRVLASVNKCKLYIGPLPWFIASEEVVRVIYASAWDIEYVSIYRFPNHDAAYAIVSFKSHRNAALARRKLRPEKLFKCNEVHVEWARVDWNPSNVYEDRGTVDDKGDVHIVRKYLQPKKTPTSSSTPMQSESNHCQKQLPPICPPSLPGTNQGNAQGNLVKSNRNTKNTRYATMLSMSATLDDDLPSRNEKTEMLTDINDNIQSEVAKDQQTCQKSDINASMNNFRNFDMWNSNLVSQLSGSSANSGSSKESLSATCDSENDARYLLPKSTSSLNRSIANRQPNDVSNYRYPCQNYRSFGKTIDQNQLIGDSVQYQVVPYRNPASCYVLLQPHQSYLYPKDVSINYPQPSLVNRLPELTGVPFANSDRRSSNFWYNQPGSIAMDKENFIVGDGDFRMRDGVLPKPEPDNIASAHVPNYSPNIVLNFTPIYASENNGTAPYLVSFDAINDEKRPRPILKQTTTGRAWL